MGNIALGPHESHDFDIRDGMRSARFWAKARCNAQGNLCIVGDSGGLGQHCDKVLGCAPPLDTRFQASFGVSGEPCDPEANNSKGCDVVDISLVDGFTLPFSLAVFGDCESQNAAGTDKVHTIVNCSRLSIDDCPCDEDMGVDKYLNLNLLDPVSHARVGCYSPCGKTTYSAAHAIDKSARETLGNRSLPYCCPSDSVSPEACNSGPINRTKYATTMHRICTGVPAYPQDEHAKLLTCPAGTKYEMVFYCPTHGSASCPVPPVRCDFQVGDSVDCPVSGKCAGDECCADGTICPSASAGFDRCLKARKLNCSLFF